MLIERQLEIVQKSFTNICTGEKGRAKEIECAAT